MNTRVHHAPEVLRQLDAIRTLLVSQGLQIKQLKGMVTTMSENLDAVKADLDRVMTDLAAIQAGVQTALSSIPGLQQTIADQKAQIDSLVAADVLTEQQAADLHASADAVVAQADAIAASLTPAPTPGV